MKNKITYIIGLILFIGTVAGWAYDSGMKAGRINQLEKEVSELKGRDNEQDEFIKTQLTFNSRVGAILEFMAK